MKKIITSVSAIALASVLSACSPAPEADSLQAAVDHESRTDKYQARDEFRHPKETLEFFELEPSMTVVEIWPGGGWYTEILAPYLADEGQLYAAHFPENSDSDYYQRSLENFKEKLTTNPVYGNVELTEFAPGEDTDIAPPRSADRILTFRNLHNWYMQEGEEGVLQAFRHFHQTLKPNGMLGIVDHRLPESADAEAFKDSGYVKESWVIDLAEQAGFEFVASSEVNANPKDTADHPKGVWTLPPTLTLGDEDKEKYEAIGESDRFTLKFQKPVTD
ncbi:MULTISPECIES: class I SAM-dependent methyltransferase [unclassified Idiomarina]|uniref:class I SAM-dependent methyltransferase n=1 Tax=unclassified Idiomarina TaxID=2614829 RepID=UPI000C65D64F|nr:MULTISPECIES: methyltransferase [unclassified Idiomarina]MAA61639.1 methyltransferase [Idiomarina sp.]|tara:strand:+ start:16019 stop:16846 length:828 start_codon:yes stop_codon:yes gene_type:complete